MVIDLALARKLLQVVDAGLIKGKGVPVPGRMCVEAAVCYAMGLPHGDNPGCVDPAVRAFKIRLNDSRWPSDAARAAGMRAIAVGQLGSKGVVDSKQFTAIVVEETIRCIIPVAFRKAASKHYHRFHKTALESAANLCEQNPNRTSAIVAKNAAAAAYVAAYAAYAADAYAADADAYAADAAAAAAYAAYAADADAAAAAAYAAYAADAYAADAAADAAAAAADAAYAAYAAAADAAAAAADAAYDNVLLPLSATICLKALRKCNSPGVALWDQLQKEVQ